MTKAPEKSHDEEFTAFKKKAVQLANKTNSLMDGTIAPVRRILDENELVFAVWQDPAAENGVGMLIVKGQQKLRECMASGKPIGLKMSAITCVELEQAVALAQMFGEPDRRH